MDHFDICLHVVILSVLGISKVAIAIHMAFYRVVAWVAIEVVLSQLVELLFYCTTD